MNIRRMMLLLCALLLASCASVPERTGATLNPTQSADSFWFVFMESGKKTPDDKEAVAKMQLGHIQNFKKLFGEKKLFAAGPMRDPASVKRGMVVLKGNSRAMLDTYFQQDGYVREGYLTLNAVTCTVNKPLATEGIDESAIEEVRIVQIMRTRVADSAQSVKANHAFIQSLVDKGTIGAWYTLQSGPVAEVLFARTKDTAALQAALAAYPAAQSGGADVTVWPQWLGKGVLK